MSDTKELYDAFWESFQADEMDWPSATVGSPLKAVHTTSKKPKPYFDFDKKLGLGFRGTAAISVQKNQIRAELSSDRRGVEFVESLQQSIHEFDHPTGFIFRLHVGAKRSDAKIEVIWQNSNIMARELWPAHQLWLKLTLELLVSIFGSHIENWEAA